MYTGGAAPTALAGATVSIVDGPNAGKSTTTDASGKYAFTALQQAGFTVKVSAATYVTQSRSITLTSNLTLDFSLTVPPASVVLTGQVSDAITSAPIGGAVVSINGRYNGTTDSAGRFSVAGLLDLGNTNFTYVSASTYVSDYHYIHGTTQNVRPYRIQRMTAGESTLVTIAPDDSLCVNDVQDFPGLGPDYVCRSVRIVAPSDGMLTIEALSSAGEHPPLEAQTVGVSPCCSERLENPTSLRVVGGTEVDASVEMPAGSTISQLFTLKTSITPR